MSVGTCTSVIGCAGGAVLATIGADQFLTGYEQLFSGQPQKTAGAALILAKKMSYRVRDILNQMEHK